MPQMPGGWVLFLTPSPSGPRNLLSGSSHTLLCGCVTQGVATPLWPDQAIRWSRPDQADSQHRSRARQPRGLGDEQREGGTGGGARRAALTLSASSGTRCCTRSSTYMLGCGNALRSMGISKGGPGPRTAPSAASTVDEEGTQA